MRIVYYTTPDFLDSDITLLREYQRMGHELMVFVTLAPHCLRGSLVDIKRLHPLDDIIPFSEYEEMSFLENYVDLNGFYFVNRTKSSVLRYKYLQTMRKMARMIKKFAPDVVHSTIPLDTLDTILLKFRQKLVVTFHDPFVHSGKKSKRNVFFRWLTLKTVPKIVILNSQQKKDFAEKYNISDTRLLVNHLGVYELLSFLNKENIKIKKTQILFFGKIASYKGLEYLCEAMLEVNKSYPDLQLVVAGGGKLYFDIEKYQNSANIKLINKYIPVDQLAQLIGESEFIVCPYKDATQSGVIMTAYALHCPIVASNVGALGSQITNGVTGILVPPCDKKSLADSIISLHSNENLRFSFSNNIINRNNSEQNSWSKIASDYIEFYKSKI